MEIEVPVDEIKSLEQTLINLTKDTITFEILSDEYQTY